MPSIAFIDTEVEIKTHRLLDVGCIDNDGVTYHKSSAPQLFELIKDVQFICGHNILKHDLPLLKKYLPSGASWQVIDTLYWSPLLFPTKPYHALVKDDKINPDGPNNPLNDAIKARDLFYDEVNAFNALEPQVKLIFYGLLNQTQQFGAFFKFINYCPPTNDDYVLLIHSLMQGHVCRNADLNLFVNDYVIELAYSLSLIMSLSAIANNRDHDGEKGRFSITPPWVLKNFPAVDNVVKSLRSKPCTNGCDYCNYALSAHGALKRYFGFEHFRTYADKPLQEEAVNAAICGDSILSVFPTGGGKSLTFQLPALIADQASRALTVVISPLQSLMKDQVDNLESQNITAAVTINGLLSPIERSEAFNRVADGNASILYLSPESLRSRTVSRLLLGRKIARFVIDEAHCFSAWGQDFRVDYLYIGEFIRKLEETKNLTEKIPVSCFTATAKQKVIEDIRNYFRDENGLKLKVFGSDPTRTNLRYQVIKKDTEEDKYATLVDLLDEKKCPTIIYVSRTRLAQQLAQRINENGFTARCFHGKMDPKEKLATQDAFKNGHIRIVVATAAFGMGIDKKDIGMVVHYEISNSLENYIQEAGRAGRDEKLSADCFVLFNEEDLSKHFVLLNQTKVSIKEIQQVWKAVKEITKFRLTVSNSALEIARQSGWDDGIRDIETRVKVAIAALEEAGYLKRGQNMTAIFASSIVSKTAQEAIDKINLSTRFNDTQKEHAVRIVKKLFSSKSRKQFTDEVAESRVDYISDHLGLRKKAVISIINLLRDEKILADQTDLTAYIKKSASKNRSSVLLETSAQIEKHLVELLDGESVVFNIKRLNEQLEGNGCKGVNPHAINTIINYWAIKGWVKRQYKGYSRTDVRVTMHRSKESLKDKMQKRHELARFAVQYLFTKIDLNAAGETSDKDHLVEFSVHEIKSEFEHQILLFNTIVSIKDVEDTLLFLSKIGAINLDGGFLIVYNKLSIERLQLNNKVQYKNEDYRKLNQYYESRVQQIHIVGEYAKKMASDYNGALQFVNDYFQLDFVEFLSKYFPGNRQTEIKRTVSPIKFQQLFGTLSPSQLEIIKDSESKNIVVAAGPGSGKTRILVHKLAALALMEDVKTDQMLMLTFSRAAVTEFKKKLFDLIGPVAHYIEIKTFHSYCFDLLGRMGTLEKSGHILKEAIQRIKNGAVELSRITKTVLVIDEAQDMDADEFALIEILIEHNDALRVIAVGDDDQCIYAFRQADANHMQRLLNKGQAKLYELTENYRSTSQLVAFSNEFAKSIKTRLKTTQITSKRSGHGEIKVINYTSSQLIIPLVNEIIKTNLPGSTGVLVHTNDEASKIMALLLNNGLKARLIQSNDSFNLFNLWEVRCFLRELQADDSSIIISDNQWSKAKRAVQKQLKNSNKLDILNKIIAGFESSAGRRKFKTDLELFIKESKLEDFYAESIETIQVATIHKSKGREFDNVFLLLNGKAAPTDEECRLLYVAITRARYTLSIHTKRNYFNEIRGHGIVKLHDDHEYNQPSELTVQLSLKDVWLDFFTSRQHLYTNTISGASMNVKNTDGCCDNQGEYLLKFSANFKSTIADYRTRGYSPKKAVVNFIVLWKKEGSDAEYKVILPELLFQKTDAV